MIKISENISLKNYNTFAIDVHAKYYAEITNENDLLELKDFIRSNNTTFLILGGGSNILFTQDFDGLVLKIEVKGIKIVEENKDYVLIEVGAGVVWDDFVLFSVEKNLGGIENLSLIPGKVGAAPIQNIGAYGQEVKDTIHSVKGIYLDTFEKHIFTGSECNFSYRNSLFKSDLKNKFLITNVLFKLKKNPLINTSYGSIEKELKNLGKNSSIISIKDVREAVIRIRKTKLPDPAILGNAGSFFKNPSVDSKQFSELKNKYPEITGFESGENNVKLSAGWLIEKCGLKGYRTGDVGIYNRQALVIVSYGNASGTEILDFSIYVKDKVQQKFGILLQEEVNIN